MGFNITDTPPLWSNSFGFLISLLFCLSPLKMLHEINFKIVSIWFFVLFFFTFFVHESDSAIKTWTHNTDIFDQSNWLEDSNDCHGIHFAETNDAQIFLIQNQTTETSEIELPETGTIVLETTITFVPSSKCIRLKPLNSHPWTDYHFWATENPAIPHLERIPCFYDHVIFPKGVQSGIRINIDEDLTKRVKSFEFGNQFFETGQNCVDPSGCVCQSKERVYCPPFSDDEIDDCLDPIQPIGFCGRICGAYILFRPSNGFVLKGIQDKLTKFEGKIFTYTSKTLNYSLDLEPVIQIVFRESSYSERSLDYAREFYSELLADSKTYSIEQIELYVSGPYYILDGSLRISLGIFFGSFLGVVGVFAIFYYLYYDTGSYQDRAKRYFMARFDNTDEGELIIEEKSLAGSVLSLDKSFDNPMYGRQTPSTSTSVDTINIDERGLKTEGISNENPFYDQIELTQTVEEE